MSIPTISITGAANGILLITDHQGVIHRIPKINLCDAADSSNANTVRLDIVHPNGIIMLYFDDEQERSNAETLRDTFLATIDAQY